MINVKFWGVRGSIPSPLTPTQVRDKVKHAFEAAQRGDTFDMLSFEESSTYGGNTTCVEVRCGNDQLILDMGTGIRELGKVQMKAAMTPGAAGITLKSTILQSHVHWDHIQGFPFWAPMYLDRRKFKTEFEFYGGKQWDSQLALVYQGQMDSPYFPVNLKELEHIGAHMNFNSIYDGWEKTFSREVASMTPNSMVQKIILPGPKVVARKLFHPQETFGYRIDFNGKSIAFTTDHEPYGDGFPRGLAELIQNTDLWITDCQYSHGEYIGEKGPQKMGWGHSYPEYIGKLAHLAGVKRVITTHHDPDADDARVLDLSRQVQTIGKVDTIAAYEGLQVTV